ncbi:MAG: SPOR domain-containing protein [Janthinobacterium lividum]
MNLSDHLRPLLRDHDCVIIPDFGGLVAAYVPAKVQPGGRHLLSPPTREVAFNQALTRNDGLLVDALCQHLGLPAAEAREALRQAVAALYRDLQAQQRTELPGIGVFRQVAGRGLQFDYTGATDLLPAVFGLPELQVQPVSVTDARLAREQQAQLVPRLRSAGRGLRLRRVVPGAAIGLLAGLAVAGLYLFNLHPTVLPAAWQNHLPRWEQGMSPAAPQQAALAQPSFTAAAPTPLLATNNAPELVAAPIAATTVPVTMPAKAAAPLTMVARPKALPVATASTPAALVAIAPASVTLAAAPAQTALPQTVTPAAPVIQPASALSPFAAQPRIKARKLPPAAAVAIGSESNIARPVPMALRKANSPALVTTSYAAARTATPPPDNLPVPTAAGPARAAALPVAKGAARKAAAPASVAARAVRPVAAKAKPVAPLATQAKTKVLAPAAPASAATINARTGRYYLVVAAYSSLARAEQGRRNLAHAGHANAKVILPYPGTRHYRLSAADFDDRPSAQVAASQLRRNPHMDKGLSVFAY